MSFSIGDALKFGWQTFKGRPGFLIGVTLIMFIVPSVPSFVGGGDPGNMTTLGAALSFLGWALSLLMSIGMMKITIAFVDGHTPTVGDLFAHARYLWRYFLASLLYGVLVLGGLLLLIIPGIIWAIRYQFAAYVIVDKDLGVLDAFRRSGQITEGHKWNLFGYAIIQGILNAIGALAFGIGVLVSAPVTMLAYAKIYRQLESGTVSAPPISPAIPTVPPRPPQTPPAA